MGASGTTTLNFGTFPGTAEATVDVSGQTGFVSTSEHEAWIQPIATADHSSDEHDSVDLQVRSQYLTDGTIRIVGRCNTPPQAFKHNRGQPTYNRLFGQYTVGWAWN